MGSFFKSKSEEQKATSTSEPWKESIPYLKEILKDSQSWYKDAANTGYISETGDLSPLYSQYLNQLQGNIGTTQGMMKPYMDAVGQNYQGFNQFNQDALAGKYNYTNDDVVKGADAYMNNDLLQQQITAATRGDVRNVTENVLPGQTLDAMESGNLNSSRAAIANAVTERGLNDRIADTSATMRGSMYNNALSMSNSNLAQSQANKLQAGGNMLNSANSALGFAGQMSGLNDMYSGVNAMGSIADINSQLQQQQQADKIGNRDYLGQLLGQYASFPTSIGGMGGTNVNSQMVKKPSGFQQALSVAGQGAQVAAPFMMSDVRLKEDIQLIGDINGINIYGWVWNDVAEKEFGLEGNGDGVLAQEIKSDYPDAVSENNGYLMVDYSKLGPEFDRFKNISEK